MSKNRYIYALILASFCANAIVAQSLETVPRLVVTVNIEQLRMDHIKTFSHLFSEGGLKKLLDEGLVYENAINNFTPFDRTAAIASISTGTTPNYNGIVASSWLDRNTLRPVFCATDKSLKPTAWCDAVSARNLLTTTVADELAIYTQGTAKIFSIAPDCESAIFSVGHAANGAYWIDSFTAQWTTSEYFADSRGQWFVDCNRRYTLATDIKKLKWTPSYNQYEEVSFPFTNKKQKPFSHSFTSHRNISEYKKSGLVNADVTDMALSCLQANAMGKDETPDMLSVTYYAGTFDDKPLTESYQELQDTYMRLDKEMERLISTIRDKVGTDNVLFVISSTGYTDDYTTGLGKIGMRTGTFYINRTANLLNMYLSAKHGQDRYVDGIYRNQIYLNHKLIEQKQLDLSSIYTQAREFLIMSDGVRDVRTADRIILPINDEEQRIKNGYNNQLCGDILVEVVPGWDITNEDNGDISSSSAVINSFPVIFYGLGIKGGKVTTLVTTDRIAPTLSKAIRIRAPNACKSLPLF